MLKENINYIEIPHCQVALVDLTKLIYLNNFETKHVISSLRKIESILQKRQLPVFLCIRNDLLSNDYFFSISKSVIITGNEKCSTFEERFIEHHESYSVSILTKPGSGKTELDDRFEFTFADGFKFKKQNNNGLNSFDSDLTQSKAPLSTFKSDPSLSEARILVEDSDRDSEDEMEADSNF